MSYLQNTLPVEQYIEAAIELIRENLWGRRDLLNKEYQRKLPVTAHPLAGHCYVACEVLHHVMLRADLPTKAKHIKVAGDTHWFLERLGWQILDPTYDQFEEVIIPYTQGIACGLLTKQPSKRAAQVLALVEPKLIVVGGSFAFKKYITKISGGTATSTGGSNSLLWAYTTTSSI